MRCSSQANWSAANSAAQGSPTVRAVNSPTAASRYQATRDSNRRTAAMTPISWSSDSPARPFASSPVTVLMMLASSGSGGISAAGPD